MANTEGHTLCESRGICLCSVKPDMPAKPSARNAGLRVTYWSAARLTWVSVYDGNATGMDTDGGRWQVVCERHSTILSVDTLKQATADAKGDPAEFCEECRDEQDERKPLADDLAEQGLSVADLDHADIRADVLAAGWTPAEIATTQEDDKMTTTQLLADLTQDAVTDVEAAAVIEWCREWARDTFADEDLELLLASNGLRVLRQCHRKIEGGLRFVLDDVRRIATEPAYSVAQMSSGSEDGPLWYVIETGKGGERRIVSGDGHVSEDGAQAELDDVRKLAAHNAGMEVLAAKSVQVAALNAGATALRERCRAEHDRYMRMRSRPVGTHDEDKIAAALREAYRLEAQAAELERMADKLAAFVPPVIGGGCQDPDEYVSRCPVCGEPIDYCQGHGPSGDPEGFRILEQHDADDHSDCHPNCEALQAALTPSRDTIAARIAKDAAEGFSMDEDSEDPESAAQRAADILRDLSADAVPSFLLRVFGLPSEYRIGEPGKHAGSDTRAQARAEKGWPTVALELVMHYTGRIEDAAFVGHYAQPDDGLGESTNLSAWREARAAFDAANVLAGHTFGGNSLDGYRADVDKLAGIALGAMVTAVQWAAYNNANPEPVYETEPRAE